MFKISLPLFNKGTLFFYSKYVKNKNNFHYGVGNRCDDGRYVVFLDYDNTPLEWIREEILLLQKYKECGTAYIFKTRKGFHVVFVEKYYLDELLEILRMTSVDKQYIDVPLKYASKIWVLRQSNKKNENIRFIEAVTCDYDKVGWKHAGSLRERSFVHLKFMVDFCGVPKSHFLHGGVYDNAKNLILAHYYVGSDDA